ncbi:MAG: DNA/RNA non-specific endonuclease [Flammeovirgaceae bacterium]|nr:DNA/RNA non-specific endonuclease [Flammeovirgaceae bacterium]
MYTPKAHHLIRKNKYDTISKKDLADSAFPTDETTFRKLEIPELKPGETIISHYAYSLSYNENHEQANWIAYELTGKETVSIFNRSDKFIVDPLVTTGSATASDYAKSGYDRGHLAPAGDMGWSELSMTESFYYSNMSPQVPGFNRGVWKRLEELVRDWAVENDTLYIVTGPVFSSNLPSIGENKVSVPMYYYKLVLDNTLPDKKGIGFILPNASSKMPLHTFTVHIDSIENLTGINFFPLLPDSLENRIESNIRIESWSWKK